MTDLDVVLLAFREAPAVLARQYAALREALGPGWAGRAVLIENAGTTAARAELAALPGDAVVLRARRTSGSRAPWTSRSPSARASSSCAPYLAARPPGRRG